MSEKEQKRLDRGKKERADAEEEEDLLLQLQVKRS